VNLLLLVIDSLRALSLAPGPGRPATPFFDRLSRESLAFSRAYATECWTLPSHLSLFTGLLPSQHGAHFRALGYLGRAPTLAEILAREGFRTEAVTRNPVLDGTIPGALRGFERRTAPIARLPRLGALPLLLALSKPRLRRQIRETGFFHPRQVANARFALDFARRMLPADAAALDHVLERLAAHRRRGERCFVFCNLFDVHAPYPPCERSLFEPPRSPRELADVALALDALAKIGRHQYLRPGFRMPERGRRLLLQRYHRAIELMDRKLERFFAEARGAGLLEDTLVVLTSDHGEAFGEHGLFLHDASLYEPNIRVPLWILHPERGAAAVDDVVSLRAVFGLARAAALGLREPTLLDESFRAAHPVAIAEHFHTPHAREIAGRFRHDQRAAIRRDRKLLLRAGRAELLDPRGDESSPERVRGARCAAHP